MLTKLALIALAWLAVPATWVFYLAVMNLKRYRDMPPKGFGKQHFIVKVHAYGVLFVGLVMDALLHFIIGTFIFLDPPRETLFTGRLKRYLGPSYEGNWRATVAAWICTHALDPFDPSGDHC